MIIYLFFHNRNGRGGTMEDSQRSICQIIRLSNVLNSDRQLTIFVPCPISSLVPSIKLFHCLSLFLAPRAVSSRIVLKGADGARRANTIPFLTSNRKSYSPPSSSAFQLASFFAVKSIIMIMLSIQPYLCLSMLLAQNIYIRFGGNTTPF